MRSTSGNSAGEQRVELDLRRLLGALLRHRWWLIGVTSLVVLGTAVFTWLQRPVYESEARIHITAEKPGLDLVTEMLPRGFGAVAGLGGSDIQTDMAVLKSRQIAEAVVDSLALHVRLLHPRIPRDSILQVVRAPRTLEGGVIELTRQEGGVYTVRAERGAVGWELPDRVEIGRPFRLGESTLALLPSLRTDPPERLQLALDPHHAAVAQTQRYLHVFRPDPGAQLVGIRFRHGDRLLAAAVPNVATASFIGYKSRTNRAESNSTVRFLQEQAVTYEAELRAAEARLQVFREQAQIVEPQTQATEQVRRLATLQASRDELQAERESLRRLLVRIEANPARTAEGRSPYRELASFPSFLTNGAVHNILQTLSELETQRSELMVRRTTQSVDVQGIDQRVAELELQLYQMARSYLDALDNQTASIDANLSRFGAELETVPSREVEYLRLLREQKLLDQVYTLIQTKLKEAEIQAAAEPANIQVVDPALVPQGPASPRPLFNLMLGLIVGLVLGTGTALARHYVDKRIYTGEDVAAATDGLPVLGAIPHIAPLTPSPTGNGRKPHAVPARMNGQRLVTRFDPRHPASEAYRALRTHLILLNATEMPRILAVTSAGAEDGKSTSSANLAVTLAQQGVRTLLIDGDLRRGALHTLFDLPQAPGLAEVLSGRAALPEVVHEIPVGGASAPLQILCSGEFPASPAELLGSPEMRRLLEHARERYEMVVVDAPPLGLIADASILAALADATVLVARAGGTERRALQLAARRLRDLNAPVSGVVLNDVDEGLEAYYESLGSHATG